MKTLISSKQQTLPPPRVCRDPPAKKSKSLRPWTVDLGKFKLTSNCNFGQIERGVRLVGCTGSWGLVIGG